MDDRSSTSKPTTSTPSQSTTPDIKSPTTRPTYSSKLSDQKSRASEVASSNTTARQPPVQQRAWTSNKNPITGRSQTPQNNFNSQNKQSVTASLREGQRVRITLASGAEFEGTWNNGPEPTSCRLTLVSQKKLPNSADIVNGAGRREQATMSFQRKEITEARVLPGNAGKGDSKVPNGNRAGFKTDTSISNNRLGAERELKRWVPDSNPDNDFSLEQPSGKKPWDQFAVNQQLFGVQTTYDEDIYTTSIDKSHPDYHKRVNFADRKAREIERSTAATSHVAEERVMDFVGGEDHRDEEEKYSGVRRQDFPPLASRENKYTPPARRAPTGHTTVKGAPVDPAIISSQLKAAPTAKQPAAKIEESKPSAAANKTPEVASESKPEAKVKDTKENESKTEKTNVKATEAKVGDKSLAAAVAATGPKKDEKKVPVELQVLSSFKKFANNERASDEKRMRTKAAKDKEVKLHELRYFSQNFKLSTPVPTDLIGIIAKDPEKQKAIQEKALLNAEEINRKKAEAAQKDKESTTASSQARTTAEQPAIPATTPAVNSQTASRPTAPQHANSPSGIPNRHQGPRAAYNNQPHYQQYNNRNGRAPPHMAPQGQATGNLAQRLRSLEQKGPHPHIGQHAGVQDMRLPPTGPANNVDPNYGRRVSGLQPPFLGNKLNPLTNEFRPNAFAQPFLPAGPSQGSSPRSSVNNIVEPVVHPTPVAGQLTRRKRRQIDIKKCFILSHIESFQQPSQGRSWDHNEGLRPAYDTPLLWRQVLDDAEKPDAPINLTYKEYFERLPLSNAAVATPNPSHAMPQLPPHQHQLPFHLQHGAQGMGPRQSPHLPPMQMHAPQHGHGPHTPFNSGDDHRMMHSNSAQSFASPRMGQVPMAYPPVMGTPGQMQYSQPVMQPYINPGAPQMGQFRSFSNNPQFIPQQPHHMGSPMMVQQQFLQGHAGMLSAGPQVPMYTGHQQFMPPSTIPPQPMAGSNGFPSPSRPVAPMMAHQGSHQGQPAGYGMSPAMPYQQPAYPQQPQGGKFTAQRPQ
ncbi:hypothetical protein B0T14DRAFT_282548 [Immersiella caudata]|uniref:LsmAD domain-containing protein n=1 Tax=Immersiella caudata TaxID=314043 RepID=A0AA40BU17_9PEZI|nr:hypothetical protein B0T14DRAFT_282548 [Immersiella caudata]